MTAPEQSDVLPPDSPVVPAPPAPGASADPVTQLAVAKKEAADNYDRFLRTTADLENFRRRTVREKEELRQFAISRVLEDLLPALDNLALGLAATKQPGADLKTLSGGVELCFWASLKVRLRSTVSRRSCQRWANLSIRTSTSRFPTSPVPRCPLSMCSTSCARAIRSMAACFGRPALCSRKGGSEKKREKKLTISARDPAG